MAEPSRRSVLAGIPLLLVTGCLGPSLRHDDTEPPPNAGDDDPDQVDLDRLVADVRATIEHIDDAAATFDQWQTDSGSIEAGTFDELRADSTALWTQYVNDVLPYTDDLRDPDIDDEWAGDGELLAELIPTHETLLVSIEEGSIGIMEGQNVSDEIQFVIDESPDVIAQTESALPESD